MTKRKAGIFTAAESVVNWFEAGNHNPVLADTPEGSASRSKLSGTGTGKSDVAGPSADKDNTDQQGQALSQATEEATAGPKLAAEGEGSTGTVSPRGQADISKPRPPPTTELAEEAAAAHRAFW